MRKKKVVLPECSVSWQTGSENSKVNDSGFLDQCSPQIHDTWSGPPSVLFFICKRSTSSINKPEDHTSLSDPRKWYPAGPDPSSALQVITESERRPSMFFWLKCDALLHVNLITLIKKTNKHTANKRLFHSAAHSLDPCKMPHYYQASSDNWWAVLVTEVKHFEIHVVFLILEKRSCWWTFSKDQTKRQAKGNSSLLNQIFKRRHLH